MALCEWRSTLRPIDADYYYCAPDGENCLADAEGPCQLPHVWTASDCADPTTGEASYWLAGSSCLSTVEDWSLCIQAQADTVCFLSDGRYPPSCEAVYCER